MSEKIFKEIEELFDIVTNNAAEDSDYNTTADKIDELSVESFDDLIDGVSKNIDKNEKGYELELKKVNTKDIEEEELVSEEDKEKFDGLDGLDGLDVLDEPEDIADEDIADEDIAELLENNNEIEEDGNSDTSKEKVGEVEYLGRKYFENGEIKWHFESTSQLFNTFYFRKRDLIEPLLDAAGKLNFDSLHDELGESHLRISDIYDPKIISQEMTLIQQYRERVKEIQLKVVRQYYLWELHTEQLEGELARTQYLKPQIKQKGLESAHMGDVQRYFAELKGIREAAKKVEENLHAAFETLSRKVTVCEVLKPVERVFNNTSLVPSTPSSSSGTSDLDMYDELPKNAVVATKEASGEFLDWDEIPG